ncbi:hypothetical protein LINGRAHAP2_LOCUS33280 [Linum grandiflorum]
MEMQYLNRGITASTSLMLVALLLIVLSSTSSAAHTSMTTMCRPGMSSTKLAAKCWLAIFEVPLCVFQIVEVFEGGSIFKLTRSCCRAFIDLTDECKIEVFQHSKLFPVIDNFCVAIGGGGSDVPSPPPHSL